MSSHGEDSEKKEGKAAKRRRIGRACDMCRLKKIRCDGQRGPGQKCSNCSVYDDECTFVQDAPKRQSRPRGYVQRLESRVAAMEELLAKLCPASDLSRELDAALDNHVRLGGSDFDDSDLSGDEAEDEDEAEGEILDNTGRERVNSGRSRDAFTYAIPPAFSPSTPLSSTRTRSPPVTSGLSSPTVDSGSQSVTLYDSQTSTTNRKPSDAQEEELESSDDEVKARQALSKLSMDPGNIPTRYFGKSSNVIILKKALEMKCAYAYGVLPKSEDSSGPLNEEELVLREKVRTFDARMKAGIGTSLDLAKHRMISSQCVCPLECPVHPWARAFKPQRPILKFPEPDLLYTLIELYFTYYNTYTPILHRGLFLAALAEGLQFHNYDFGSVVLMVCALGARFSDDRRVLLEEEEEEDGPKVAWVDEDSADNDEDICDQLPEKEKRDTHGWHSAGWKWFRQVRIGCRALVTPPSLYDLQIACLASIYFRGSSAPEASRTVTGLGLRLAQDLGAHRKKIYSSTPSEEQELLKRAFWVLVWLEWTISPMLGRPCGIQYEDFDVDLPIDCDDEYWVTVDPNMAFKQPPGKPSLITYFNCALRLNQINAFAMRTIYSTNKSKALLGFIGPQWEQRIVAELDSALNAWLDAVPEHLRWDPQNPNEVFLHQSANLYMHKCRALVCSCPRCGLQKVGGKKRDACNMMPLFMSGIVLMLNMWGSGSPVTKHTLKEMEDIHKVMEMLKAVEPRWHTAGRLWDMLHELAIVGELPLLETDSAQLYYPPRRVRDARIVIRHLGGSSSRTSRSTSLGRGPEHSSGRSSASHLHATAAPQNMNTPSGSTPSLPVRSEELGRLPLHPVFDSDPSSSLHVYDMSPSVFNAPPTATPTSPPIEPADPSLDSIFTAGRTQRSSSLPHLHAPKPISPAAEPFPASAFAASNPDTPPQSSTYQDSATPFAFPPPPIPSSAVPARPDDTLTMWSNAPAGFEWDDWGNYITNFNAPEATATDFAQGNIYNGIPPTNTPSKIFTFYDSPM